MNEMKCPACGESVHFIAFTLIVACDVCNFMCHEDDLPRIAAAMDLARCIADSDIDCDEDHARWLWDETKEARAKVVEAFK